MTSRSHPRNIVTQPRLADRDGRRSLTEQVFEELKSEIVGGRLAPGEPINEPDLAERYGVSKTPVREALRLMVQEGWIVVLPRKGYLVRPLALEDIREIFALRRMLEPSLAAEAAVHATPESVQALQDLIDEQRNADSFEKTIRAAADFHVLIAKMSRSARAVRIVASLIDEVTRLSHLMPRLERNLRSVTELDGHERITEAIAQNEPQAASDLMRAHLAVAGRGMTDAFGDQA